MTDHHDFGDDDHYDDGPPPFDDHGHPDPHPYAEEPWHEEPSGSFPGPLLDEPAADPDPVADAPAETGPDPVPPAAGDPVEVFPPALEVQLPEPVDGFPWIDTGSLGPVDAGVVDPAGDPVRPEELAEYAATELPPAADPWAALADSDDPATAALAKWWSQN